MLTHPLMEKLKELRFHGIAQAFTEQLQQSSYHDLPFEERFALLIEREATYRENRKLQNRLYKAKLKQTATLADIDYQNQRGLDKAVIHALSQNQWLDKRQNLIITGPTGTGKTFLACALAHHACLQGFSSLYIRLPRLFQALLIAKGDGSYEKYMLSLTKMQLLILDDWGLTPLDDVKRRDLLEVLDERHQRVSTIVSSQLPLSVWHESIGDATLADAILDRLIHNAHKIVLQGESMRKIKNGL